MEVSVSILRQNLLKYFLHGVVFTMLFTGFDTFWIYISAWLGVFRSIIGVAFGLTLFFFVTGFVNMVLTAYIWNIDSRIRFWSTLFHGLTLCLLLFLGNIPAFYVQSFIFSFNIVIAFSIFIAESFFNGFVARQVADWVIMKEEGVRNLETNRI